MKIDRNLVLISFLSALYISILLIFPNYFYWVDDFYIIHELQQFGLSKIFDKFNSSFLVLTKIIFYIDIYFLNFQPQIYSFISITILILSVIVFFKLIKTYNIDKKYYFFFILIFFSPKIFPSISQPINLNWFFGLFFTLCYFYFSKKNSILSLFCIIINFFNLGLGIVLCVYIILTSALSYYYKKNFNKIYLLTSFILLIIYFNFDQGSSNLNLKNSAANGHIALFNFFSIFGNFFLPWIKPFVFIGFAIGLFQFYLLKFIFKLDIKKIFENNFIFFGIVFGCITSLFRPEIYNTISPRYVFGIIFFQLGFFIELINYKKLINKKLFKWLYCSVFCFLFFSPYLGIHWQVNRSFKSSEILKCFNDKKIKSDECYRVSQNILFFNKNSFDKNVYKKIINEILDK